MMGVQQPQGQSLLSNQRSGMGSQMQSMMGVQSQNQSLLNSQRGNMGSQMQGLMVQYTPLPSYQVSGAKDGKWGREGNRRERKPQFSCYSTGDLVCKKWM
uniref:Uncharacterized protein n=1 Tax=Micrurus corallinus TaxID=54390 RepID=A0A2D4G9Q8_MICCO